MQKRVDETRMPNDNRVHGSKRAAGAVVGAIAGLIIGGAFTAGTNNMMWIALFAVTGIFLGGYLGQLFIPRR